MRFTTIFFLLSILGNLGCRAQKSFQVIPLGVKGGIQESNLSAYLVAPNGSDQYVCLDAGTLRSGIQKAVDNKTFLVSPDSVLRNYIMGYLISHAHLDHISGLIINSTEDSPKNIYAFPNCMETIRDHYFNWQSWPNFGNEGKPFALKKYTYKALEEGQEIKLDKTEMHVTPFKLSHSNPFESSAFLIRADSAFILYVGDTGPDEVEKSNNLGQVWEKVAPLLSQGKLKGIFLEVSYPDEQADSKLYGHLTPRWFFVELEKLSLMTGKEKMKGFPLVVTHLKPGGGNEAKIKSQLEAKNSLGLHLIIPEQGKRLEF